MSRKDRANRRFGVTLGAMLLLMLMSLLFGLAWPPLIEAGPTLPPRNPPPTSRPSNDDHDRDDKPLGAYIELEVQPAQAGLWATVEWQDSAGGWHPVEGWNRALSGGGERWWVAAQDFGKGPFRWVVSRGPDGSLLGVSELFNLPGGANETIWVSVSTGG